MPPLNWPYFDSLANKFLPRFFGSGPETRRSPITTPTASTCRALPAETWGRICSYIDDVSLWMILRHVSGVLRSEAEYEFVRTRLARLKLNWMCRDTFFHDGFDFELEFQYSTNGTINQNNERNDDSKCVLLGLNEDGTRASFYLPTCCKVQGVRGDYVADQQKLRRMPTQLVCQALQDVDLHIAPTNDGWKMTSLTTILGYFSNNNPLPAIRYNTETQQCSFDWKTFLTAFYADYMLVEKLKHPKTPYAFIAICNEISDEEFARQYEQRMMWPRQRGKSEGPLFEHAYLVRLKRAHGKAGLRFAPSAREFDFIKEEVSRLRCKRNFTLFVDLRNRYAINEFLEEE